MNQILFYDTETTGLPIWSSPSGGESQPHIVQLGAKLIDMDTKELIDSMDVIIKPDGWIIPDEVAKIHGITTEIALEQGIPELEAVQMFFALWMREGKPVKRIGHNESFDARILRIATKRFPELADMIDPWKEVSKEDKDCTMWMAFPIMKLPPTAAMRRSSNFKHKKPNLSEAYLHFTGKELEGAHNAMVDVEACEAVYFKIIEEQKKAA